MEKLGIEEKIKHNEKMKKCYYSDYYSLTKMLKTPKYYVIYMNASKSL